MNKAIIIGDTGQDGFYLKELLLQQKATLLGINSKRLWNSSQGDLGGFDMLDFSQVERLVGDFQPDFIFYLAAVHQSSADKPWADGELWQASMDVNQRALIYFLESIRLRAPLCRLFYAASSHIFGNPTETPQTETTPLNPDCIYGITKTAGLRACWFYRENHQIFASVGIFYNHESPRRSAKFVSQKIIQEAIRIQKGESNALWIGNLKAQIDWGYAAEYMEAVWKLMQLEVSSEFIISSGVSHTVKDFVSITFEQVGLNWEDYVQENSALISKKPKTGLLGNPAKLKTLTGWEAQTTLDKLVALMLKAASSNKRP